MHNEQSLPMCAACVFRPETPGLILRMSLRSSGAFGVIDFPFNDFYTFISQGSHDLPLILGL